MSAPEKLTIDTPEQVPLEFVLASVGSRFLAVALDTLFQAGGFLVLVLIGFALSVLSSVFRVNAGTWVIAGVVLTGFLIYYGYFAAFEAVWNGQTPGKRIVGLRVILVAGRPITVYEAILRNLMRIADQLPGMYAIGILSILLTEKNQRLGDLAAGTVVVYELPIERHDASAIQVQAARTRHGASQLADDELVLIETFLRRRADLGEQRRARTAREIATRIRQRLALPDDPEDEAFLEEIVAEFRSRQRYR